MVRGRSIDKTLPNTRALTQQRDYRARKAARQVRLQPEVAVPCSWLTRQADLEEENRRLKVENARLAVENAALRCRLDELDLRSQARTQHQSLQESNSVDPEVWQQIEDAKTGVEIAMRQFEKLQALRPVTLYTPESVPSQDHRIEAEEVQNANLGEESLVAERRCCGSTQKPPSEDIGGKCPPLVEDRAVAVPTLASITAPSPSLVMSVDAELPSFHLGYPQSNEREECCLGLISCEPTAAG